MIRDFKEVALRADTHVFDDYKYKLQILNEAVDLSLSRIQMRWNVRGEEAPVYIAWSGGVDSTLILAKMLKNPYGPITAHTLGTNEHHPDVIAARRYHHQVGGFTHLVTLTGEDWETEPYKLLMDAVRRDTIKVICCDVADELFGGYYTHLEAKKKLKSLREHMSHIILNHLLPLDTASTAANVEVVLPYADPAVFQAASLFSPEQLVTTTKRKRPILDLARVNGVPRSIIYRRKYGLNAVGWVDWPAKPRKRRKKRE